MKTPPKASGPAGFTIVEVLVTTLITSVLLAGFLGLLGGQVSATRAQSAQVDLQQTVRDVTEMFSREVRRAGANPTCANFAAIEFASDWMVRIKSDLNGNGTIDSTGDEDVVYQYAFGDLRRIANGSIDVLIPGIDWSRSRFRFFDKDGDLLQVSEPWSGLNNSKRSKVRRIEFVLDLDQASPDGHGVQARASTDVSLRNRFFVRSTTC